MTIFNTLKTAFRATMANKLRTALTTLGIIIGVASVIAMLALGNGARAAVEANFRFLGADTVQIRAKRAMDDGEFVEVGQILSYEDGLYMPIQVELVRRIDMSVAQSGKVRKGRNVLDVNITGSTAGALAGLLKGSEVQPVGWPEGEQMRIESFIGPGRFFTPAEVLAHADVCVLGYDTAEDLFDGDDPLDEVVWVNRRRCIVIGVLAELEVVDPAKRNRLRPNESFYLPISTAINHLYDEPPSVNIIARVHDEARMFEAKAQIENYLRQRHQIEGTITGGSSPQLSPLSNSNQTPPNNKEEFEDDFELVTRRDILGAQQEAAKTFSFLLAGMAAVSLLVGGIGIMNVMLVSVTERTREIGVRMAVGASGRDIVLQFLLEAILISAGGGILGLAIGILSIPLAAQLNRGQALLAPNSLPLAFGVALLTGMVFGLYPALRAARLDPIEALRYE